jgi:hypothetical protein
VRVISNVVFLVTTVAALVASLWLHLYFVALLAGWLLVGELTPDRPRRPPVPIPPMNFDPPDSDPVAEQQPEPDPEAQPETEQGQADG